MSKNNSKDFSMEMVTIDKKHLYINEAKVQSISHDISEQLDVLQSSLMNIHVSLNKLVKQKIVKDSRANSFKSWSQKAKAQSIAATKLKGILSDKFSTDLQLYPIQLLDERISALEEKLDSLLGK